MWRSIQQQWFLFGLGFAFAVGLGGGEVLDGLLDVPYLRSGFVFVVMCLTGVTLRADAIRRSVTRPTAAILASSINMFALPAMCWLAWQFLPSKLGAGLYVVGLVPCTLASAAIWTRRAGGDDSIALLTTMVTNLACVAVVPIGLWLGMGQTSDIPIADQVGKLFTIIVIPLALAQACRRWGLAAWADRNKPLLSQVAQVGILVMVFFGSLATRRLIPEAPSPTMIAGAAFGLVILALAAATVHVSALWMGISGGRRLGLDRDQQIAVGFSGSQKTLMVGLQIAIDCGVSVVPMILYHLLQLLIDTWVAQRWRDRS